MTKPVGKMFHTDIRQEAGKKIEEKCSEKVKSKVYKEVQRQVSDSIDFVFTEVNRRIDIDMEEEMKE